MTHGFPKEKSQLHKIPPFPFPLLFPFISLTFSLFSLPTFLHLPFPLRPLPKIQPGCLG